MFLTKQDYEVVIGETAYKAFSRLSEKNVQGAERTAIEEIAGYLRTKYDVDAVFSGSGTARNQQIVTITCDIALYHLSASLPQMMGAEIRKERYDRAVKWLEGVQAGKIVPELPTVQDVDGNDLRDSGIIYHSQPPLRHNW